MPQSPKRKLAAIMFTDMAGFTELMQRDEALALTLRDRHRQVLREAHERHHGEIVHYFGDGTLSLFDSVVEAVACAVAMQQALRAPPWVPLRIGIHTGDVVVDQEGVFGDGVNIASRIESFSVPGAVLISEQVYHYIGNQPELPAVALGVFHLKNVARPMAIYAVTATGLTAPDAAQLSGKGNLQSPAAATLPAPLTSFIGRSRETAEIKALLKEHRLVTLTGPGGAGKTRLSLQVGETMQADFADGVCFVPLAAIRETAVVPSVIGKNLGVPENPARDVLDSLAEFLRDKELLLILDNFEQIVEAAPVVRQLLARCPGLTVLVTSRVVLRLQGEREYPVPPLPLPDLRRMVDLESLSSYPSIGLFLDRARAVRPDFELTPDNVFEITGICSRLDSLPLAIELAASRIKLFPPAAMLERLDRRLDLLKSPSQDRPERHQTLRQTIAWSYDLLAPDEQVFFRRLAIFTGGFSAPDAEAVCFAGQEPEDDVYDLIANLLDKSLLRGVGEAGGEPRYMLLETIREYGLEQLDQQGELTDLRQRHARHFLAVAEQVEPHLTGKDQKRWLDRLEADNDNFRAVLLWAEENGEVEAGLRLAGALWRFWAVRSHMVEGRQRLEKLLQLPATGVDSLVRAKALNGIGTLINMLAQPARAKPYFEESLAIARSRNDERQLAAALNHIGWSCSQLLEYEAASTYSEEARVLNRKLGQDRGVAVAHNNLGWIQIMMGNFQEALIQFEKGLALRRKIGDHRGEAYSLSLLAWPLNNSGRYPEAEINAQKAIDILRPLQDEQLAAWALTHLGNSLLLRVDFEGAEKALIEGDQLWKMVSNEFGQGFIQCLLCRLFLAGGRWDKAGESLDMADNHWQKNGSPFGANWVACLRGLLHAGLGEPEKAMHHLAGSLTRRRTYGEQLGVVESVEALLSVSKASIPADLAARLLGLTAAERERLGAPVSPLDRPQYEETRAYYRSALGDQAFAEQTKQGAGAEREELLDRLLARLTRVLLPAAPWLDDR